MNYNDETGPDRPAQLFWGDPVCFARTLGILIDMKIATKDQTTKFKNGDTCVAYEYPLSDKELDTAIVEVIGKYPVSGSAVNTVCKELAYVLKGSGKLFVDDKEYLLEEGTEVLIEPNEKFSWEGNFTLIISCTPAWYPEQHKLID